MPGPLPGTGHGKRPFLHGASVVEREANNLKVKCNMMPVKYKNYEENITEKRIKDKKQNK